MPLYEYKCQSCGSVFEVMQRFSDPPLATHEGCGGAVERLLSTPAFHFKGSGWYVTDYARSGNGSGKSFSETKPAESKPKTESKPAKGPETSSKT